MHKCEPINILFLIYDLERGGPEMRLLDLQKSLPANIKLHICVTSYNLSLLPEFIQAGARVFVQPVGKGYLELNKARRIHKYTFKNYISSINSFGLKELFIAAAIKGMSLGKIKIIYHSVDLLHNYNIFQKTALAILLKIAHKVICNSEHSHNLIRKLFVPQKKISVIRNGVNSCLFKKTSFDMKQFPNFLSIRKDDFILGTIANFRIVKNYPFLMHAFMLLKKKHKNLKLICVGGGYYLSYIKEMALQLQIEKDVMFTGYAQDIVKYLSMMDVFVLCSIMEGFPNVLLQAMAMKIPVVSADVGGCSEIINNMSNGILYPSNDVERFNEAIEILSTDKELAKSIGINARKTVEENFSLKKMIESYASFYCNLKN